VKKITECDEILAHREIPRSHKTVLVVEDEAFVRESTCETLRRAGYHVLQAASAAKARQVFSDASIPIDLLVCDAVLPDSNGMHLSELLHWQSPQLQTIMASGYPLSVLRDQFRLADEHQVLSKPYAASLLLAQVEALLNGFMAPIRTPELLSPTPLRSPPPYRT
jgi:DNA-binding response OmpR family regulator